jgi:ABC-type transport system substrate-binding protein
LTALLFVAALIIIPISVTSQDVQDRFKAGPYVDDLVFEMLYSFDAQVPALQNDNIDILGDYLNLEQYFALESSENIETVSTLRNGYGYVTINTAKYPLNITAFRRAIAFALDKERISEEAFMNLSEPLDSCIPKINPFSIEGELLEDYYTSDITTAQQLLTDAGFNDTDSDGDIEAPDGSEISIEVYIPDFIAFGIPDGVGLIFETALQELHINYTRQTDDWITNIYNRRKAVFLILMQTGWLMTSGLRTQMSLSRTMLTSETRHSILCANNYSIQLSGHRSLMQLERCRGSSHMSVQ